MSPRVVERLRSLGVPASMAHRIVATGGLAHASDPEFLCSRYGLDPAIARRIADAMAAAADLTSAAREPRVPYNNPFIVVATMFGSIASEPVETFAVLCLDPRMRSLELRHIASGTAHAVEVHPRDVFRTALLANAHSVIVAHNHPSGDATPSDADTELTRRLVAAGDAVGIPVRDHLIVCANAEYFSFAERRMIV